LPAVAVTPLGLPGEPVGVTGVEATEAGPVPAALVALTTKVYAVPFVSPETDVLVAGGAPVTVTGVWALAPMSGVMV
jgi:hypothetical protein